MCTSKTHKDARAKLNTYLRFHNSSLGNVNQNEYFVYYMEPNGSRRTEYVIFAGEYIV